MRFDWHHKAQPALRLRTQPEAVVAAKDAFSRRLLEGMALALALPLALTLTLTLALTLALALPLALTLTLTRRLLEGMATSEAASAGTAAAWRRRMREEVCPAIRAQIACQASQPQP